jgi:hypothetical protein
VGVEAVINKPFGLRLDVAENSMTRVAGIFDHFQGLPLTACEYIIITCE